MVKTASAETFYWFDYETFGRHPAYDRPAQFAGQRTDASLRPIGEPLVIYCKPADDYLPEPEACLITGITPQLCLERGLPEAEFIAAIRNELATPGTCNLGYNNIRFDDEFTRHILFRNFLDPYEHEWKHGNSRWDLLDIVRLTRALRPDGIEWPVNENGTINNKLETLTQANGLVHDQAHDALSDVHATIALARLLREKKTRLFDYLFSRRDKNSAADQLNLRDQKMVVHVSGMIPGEFLHTALVLPLARHPVNKNGILVYDLRYDPQPFLELDEEELALRLFSKNEELPADMPRVPVKTVHTNRCPVLVPLNTLDEAAQQRTRISLSDSENHARLLRNHKEFAKKLASAFKERVFEDASDVDGSLYSGGFFTDSDKRAFRKIHNTAPADLATLDLFYDDARIPDLFFRFRARNWPETLADTETLQWREERFQRLCGSEDRSLVEAVLSQYRTRLDQLCGEYPDQQDLLDKLADYARQVLSQ